MRQRALHALKSPLVMGLVTLVLAVAGYACMSANASVGLNWEKLEEESLAHFKHYLTLDTTNPPGRTVEAIQFLKEILEKEGIEVTLYESDQAAGKVNLLARLKAENPKEKPLLLLNHVDVVPVEKKNWLVEPFGAVEREGEIWGRGALDMKSLGVMELMAMIARHRSGRPLERDLLFLAVCDEEIGGIRGARWMVEEKWEDLDPGAVIDEGGFIANQVFTEDDTLYIAPAVGEKKVLWLKMIASGQGGHGSMPHSHNPTLILMDALNRILGTPPQEGEDPVVAQLKEEAGELAVNPFTFAITHDTISLTSLDAGVGDPPKVNIIPTTAEATLDCRLLPQTSVTEFVSGLVQKINDPRISFKVLYEPEEGVTPPPPDELVEAVSKVLKKEFPEAKVTPILLPGGTDSRFFRARGVPAIGFNPIELSPKQLELLHGDNERIDVDQFKRGVRLFYQIVDELT